jgi:hypothetical protein
MYSDRHPYTVTAILSLKRIMVRADDAKRIDRNGCSEQQEYQYIPNTDAPAIELRMNKRGQWKRTGDPDGATYIIGIREEYYDFTR